jgi:glycosyltransferase involved in cell wall biosynthesis
MRLAFVVQRYGLDINGGAEMECRRFAERLSSHMDVEVITTCAEDLHTWRNVYPAGLDHVNAIPVWRFPTDRERNIAEFNSFTQRMLSRPHSYFDEMRWMELQGPISSGLLRFLELKERQYDLFFFVTFLYASTFLGLQSVPHKSVLFPTAHDDPWIRLNIFRPLFHLPRAFAFNTAEEQGLVHRLFRNEHIPSQIVGNGLDLAQLRSLAQPLPDAGQKGASRVSADDEYIVYVGRIDPSKGCDQLFEYFLRYKAERSSPVKLVLIGKASMHIPDHPDIVPLGFMRDSHYAWMQRARALVLPSAWESLSLVVLESLVLGVPVLVNGQCDVLVGHCKRGNAGLYYRSYEEFAATLSLLLIHAELRAQLGRQGQTYVEQNYAWDVVEKRLVDWLHWVVYLTQAPGAKVA